jgi:hypothetical protein
MNLMGEPGIKSETAHRLPGENAELCDELSTSWRFISVVPD